MLTLKGSNWQIKHRRYYFHPANQIWEWRWKVLQSSKKCGKSSKLTAFIFPLPLSDAGLTVSSGKCFGFKGKQHLKRTDSELQSHNQWSNLMRRKIVKCLVCSRSRPKVSFWLPMTFVYKAKHGSAVCYSRSSQLGLWIINT